MRDPLTPEQAEAEIARVTNEIANGVRPVNEALDRKLAADRVYDRAYAEAYLGQEGPAHLRRFQAELATADVREARDVQTVAYQYARSRMEALKDELSGLQSQLRSVQAMFGAAGKGQW